MYMYTHGYIYIYIYIYMYTCIELLGNMPLLRLQSSEGKFTMSREIQPVRRSVRRHEVARLRKWHVWCLLGGVIGGLGGE